MNEASLNTVSLNGSLETTPVCQGTGALNDGGLNSFSLNGGSCTAMAQTSQPSYATGSVGVQISLRAFGIASASIQIKSATFGTGQVNQAIDANVLANSGAIACAVDAALFIVGSATTILPLRAGVLIGKGRPSTVLSGHLFELDMASALTIRAQISTAPDWSDPAAASNFSVQVAIAGVLVETTGMVDISGEESSAMLATCRVPSPPAWSIGDSMTIDLIVSAHVTRLFMGKVTEVQYDPAQRLCTITASDGLQALFDAMDNGAIDDLTPGATTTPGNSDSGFAYLKHRLASIPASLDLDVSGAPRLTHYDEGTVLADPVTGALDGSETITLVRADQLINRVDLTVQASWVRLAQTQLTMRWQAPWTLCQTFGYGMSYVPSLPAIGEIQSVFEATGWQVDRYFEEPYLTRATGVVQCPTARGPVPVPLLDGAGTTSIKQASAVISKRYSRSMQANASITMTVPESINLFGEHKQTMSANYRDEQDDTAFLAADTSTSPDESSFIVGSTVTPAPSVLDATDPNGDAIHDALDSVALGDVVDDAMNRALADMATAHRASRIGATMPIRPDITRTHRITLDLPSFMAAGKVFSLHHVLDTDNGSATTEVTCALFMGGDGQPIGIEGSTTDFSAVTVATRSNAIAPITDLATHVGSLVTSEAESEDWTGWIINAEPPETGATNVYQTTGFLVTPPDITLPDQTEADITPASSWRVHLPIDQITYR